MKLAAALLLTTSFLGCSGASKMAEPTSSSRAEPNRAEAIVDEHLKRDAAPYRKDHIRFTVTEKGNAPEITELDVWRRESGDVTTTLSVITKPSEDAGTGSLTVDEKGKPAVVVTYAASRGEFRETDTGKMFIGGLTAQELLGTWDKYDYKLIGERGNGFEVEGKLKDGQKSAIAMSRVVFDKDNYLPIEMNLFDNLEKKIRTYVVQEVKSANGRPYIAKTVVTNHVYGAEITIEVISREYPGNLDDALFTRERLKQTAPK